MIRIAIALASLALVACSAGRKSQWEASAAATAAQAADVESLRKDAQAAWDKRDDEASLARAISLYERIVQQSPTDVTTLTRLARAHYFHADAHLRKKGTNSPEYLDTFEKGVAAGERAMAAGNEAFRNAVTSGKTVQEAAPLLSANEVEAAYWYAACLGKWARAKGIAAQLGNKDRIKAVMNRATELNPDFFFGAMDRYWGSFYAVAPGFAGGDMNKSKEHFEKSMLREPRYIGTRVLMADAYAVKLQDRALFDKLLEEVLAQPDDVIPELIPETKAEKLKAQELKAKAKELF